MYMHKYKHKDTNINTNAQTNTQRNRHSNTNTLNRITRTTHPSRGCDTKRDGVRRAAWTRPPLPAINGTRFCHLSTTCDYGFISLDRTRTRLFVLPPDAAAAAYLPVNAVISKAIAVFSALLEGVGGSSELRGFLVSLHLFYFSLC